jgi:hypothetical protein
MKVETLLVISGEYCYDQHSVSINTSLKINRKGEKQTQKRNQKMRTGNNI